MDFPQKDARKSLLPFILVIKTEVVGLIVLSYFALQWLKENYMGHAYFDLAAKGIYVICGLSIVNLYYYLFKRLFASMKENSDVE